MALHLKKLESPSPKDALCQIWLKLAQWFLRRSRKEEEFTDKRMDGQTDGRTTVDQKSSLELSAQVSLKFTLEYCLCFGEGNVNIMIHF